LALAVAPVELDAVGGLIVLRKSALRSGVAAVVADAVPDRRSRLPVTRSYRAMVTAHDGDRGGP
jgi:hypothetical protein